MTKHLAYLVFEIVLLTISQFIPEVTDVQRRLQIGPVTYVQ